MEIKELKMEKQSKGITNKELSIKSGIPLGTVNKIMSGSIKSVKQTVYEKLKKVILTENQKSTGESYGFIKCGAVTPKIKVADVDYNVEQIKQKIKVLTRRGVKLIVFPELCVTGYTCGDLFYQNTLLRSAEKGIIEIAKFSELYEAIIFIGSPIKKDGRIYNCAVGICKGKILGVIPKKHLPDYNEFYETRQFTTSPENNSSIKIGEKEYPFGIKYIFENEIMPSMTVGVEICEDLWVAESPSAKLTLAGANVVVNLSASNEVVGKAEYRKTLIKAQSGKCVCGYVYANAGEGESSTDLVFSGHNLISENGKILAETELFSGADAISDIDVEYIEYEREKTFAKAEEEYERIKFRLDTSLEKLDREIKAMPFVPQDEKEIKRRAEQIMRMQAEGLKKRIEHTGAKKIVIGVSGGLDSTLAIIVSVKALKLLKRDTSDIIAITMPCFGTTKRTKGNAEKTAELYNCTLREIDITESVKKHFKDIGHSEENRDVTYENSQARERTQVLMDVANSENGLVVGTGDLSELALGWATYNGDQMSMYGVNGSVPKTLIRYLIKYEASNSKKELKEVLEDVLNTPVSPELIPHENGEIKQKTEDIIGPYTLHDFYLYNTIRLGYSPKKVYYLAKNVFKGEYDEKTLYKWLENFIKRFFSQQFKRSCMPDGVKVGTVALSPRGDWRMPSDATRSVWEKELNEIKQSITV